MKQTTLDLTTVLTWEDFHDLFTTIFGFPAYYGRNMNAWIDCMEDFAIGRDFLVLELKGMTALKTRCPDIHEALNECSAFINHRAIVSGGKARIALAYGND